MDFPKTNYDYCFHDSIKDLLAPPVDFYPIYSWGWRGSITEEGITKRLDIFSSRDVKRVYVLPVTSEFCESDAYYKSQEAQKKTAYKYLSREYFETTDFLAKEAKKRGIKLWLYDEGGYPSGAANGEVISKHPHLAPYVVDEKKQKHEKRPAAQPYPDLLKEESTDCFIEYTHKRYKDFFGEKLSEIFPVIFTDEPAVAGQDGMLPWTDGLEEKFLEKFGYDIDEHFGLLFSEKPNALARKVRADYKDLISELFSKNYFRKIKWWCAQNGMLFTGHVGGDDVAFGNAKWGYHHILRCLREMDIPGIDMIWRQVFPARHMPGIEPYAPLCANTLFPRYASSAAHQIGARLALSESYAIYGAGITFAQMRWVYNYQIVRGINVLNPMNTAYSHEGASGAHCGLPNFSSPLPTDADLKEFNLWAARASYIASAGTPMADSALYMPMRDIWGADSVARNFAENFEKLGGALEKRGCDIDVIDDDAILAATLKDGHLAIGNANYKTLYFNKGVTVLDNVKEKLKDFINAGGKVIVCGKKHSVRPIICDKKGNLRATRRKTEEGTIYYLYNEAFRAKSGTVSFPLEKAATATQIDLITGERKTVSVCPYAYDLTLGEEAVLLFDGKNEEKAKKKEAYKNQKSVKALSFRKLSCVNIRPEGLIKTTYDGAFIKTRLKDLRVLENSGFSGEVEYAFDLDFSCGAPQTVLLDLGEVCYSAEVFLNGKTIGAKIFPPFRFTLSDLKEKNQIKIRVSNTMANAYSIAKYEEWLPNYEPNYMKKLELSFEKESLRSGLFGPIKIKW